MSASNSNLSRSTAAIATVVTLAAACGTIYGLRSLYWDLEPSASTSTLHRSNAVHRRRRRTNTGPHHPDGRVNPAADLPIFIDEALNELGDDAAAARVLTDGETIVDDQAYQEEVGWSQTQSYQRNGQNIVQLLFRVSEDATRRNAYVHRGNGCNICGVVPIRGIRYHCANCADFDLCEGCESQGLHTKTHIFYKIRVPAPSFGSKPIQPVPYSGDPDNAMTMLPKEITTKLSRETGFERPELDAYWEQWTFMANTDWRDDPDDIGLAMDRKTFERCLVPSGGYRHNAPSLIFERMFAFYDTNKDDLIGFPEFLHGIAYRKKKNKWAKIFEGYDIDGDGYVDRKDFLRMFRSYYVLYRQLHRDILQGMEIQQTSTVDAHKLVSGRQPLSSAFGDGRFPGALDTRAGEGKSVQANGELEVSDGKGVVNESSNDTGNREDVFKRDRSLRTGVLRTRPRNSAGYWGTMLNPPETIEQIPETLNNLNRVRGAVEDILSADGTDSNAHPALLVPRDNDEDLSSGYTSAEGSDAGNENTWPPSYVTVTDEDAASAQGPGTTLETLSLSFRQAAVTNAMLREGAQREIHERWKRRHFYTDEEEGATPPSDWKEDDDVMVNPAMAGESSKRLSRHSRSSSKVRFAEDMDDFDTRSNPSTSSRSVPERWGGMEIPDAERDAGKEILYQVAQQAFNELLDPFFKEKEDEALKAAAAKSDLENFGHLYEAPDFDNWAREKEAREASKNNEEIRTSSTFTAPVWPNFPEVDVGDVRQRPLDQLLAATGYEVAHVENDNESGTGADEPSVEARSHGIALDLAEGTQRLQTHNATPGESNTQGERANLPSHHVQTTLDLFPRDDESSGDQIAIPATATSPTVLDEPSAAFYRDPTLPQFRPNASPQPMVSRMREEFDLSPQTSSVSLHNLANNQPVLEPSTTADLPDQSGASVPSRDRLYELWKSSKAVTRAQAQGGWGRLDFDEFHEKVTKFVKDGKFNQMDYLGSWIEFCIP